VTIRDHKEYPRLLAAMKVAARHFRPWSGVIYRSAPPKWAAGHDMLTGAGSMKSGARFNAPGRFPAVYGSTTPELAMIESLAYQRRSGLPVERAMPLVFKAISVYVERLLDLSDPTVLTDLRVTAHQLLADPWWSSRARGEESLSQAVGRAAHAHAVQALRVGSAHTSDHGFNVVALPGHVRPPSLLKVLHRPSHSKSSH